MTDTRFPGSEETAEEDEYEQNGPRDLLCDQDWEDDAKPRSGPSPFKPAVVKPEQPAPPKETPKEAPKETPKVAVKDVPTSDKTAKPSEQTAAAYVVPEKAATAAERAFKALNEVVPGAPLPEKVRSALDEALSDAGKIDIDKAKAEAKRLSDDLANARKLPDGRTLPPWTPAQEQKMWQRLNDTQTALQNIPEPTKTTVSQTLEQLAKTPITDSAQRLRLKAKLDAEAATKPDGTKVTIFLLKKNALDQFMSENALGMQRRNLHQRELVTLNAPAVCASIYAVALDKSGQQADQKKLESLIKTANASTYAKENFPEITALNEKYRVSETQLDSTIPGREALRKALEIMAENKGTAKERLEKARPFFDQAVGASDRIDPKQIDEDLKKIAKEALELGEGTDSKRMDELDDNAVSLLEKIRQPLVARLALAKALSEAAIESKDDKLHEEAVKVLQSILKFDEGARYDPLVQGALKQATEKQPIDFAKALELGKKEVERIREEDKAKGKNPDEVTGWRKHLNDATSLLLQAGAFMVATWLLGKAWKPIGNAGSNLRRNWELSRRLNAVQVERTAGEGEAPKLVHKDSTGKEREVQGVRKEDGALRLKDGDKIEVVKLGKKESLVLKVPKDSAITPEQVKEAAAKALSPTSTDQLLHDLTKDYQSELAKKQAEIDELKRQQGEGGQPKTETVEERNRREAGKELHESIPERLRKELPTEFSPDIKDAMEAQLEANEKKWSEKFVREYKELMEAYKDNKPDAVERVNKMMRDGAAAGSSTAKDSGTAGTGKPAPTTAGTGREGGPAKEVATTGGEGTPTYQTAELKDGKTTKPALAIETLTTPDGLKFIESIPIGELTHARVQDKMDKLEAEIKAAKDRGQHDYARELEQIDKEYKEKKTATEKEAYCKEVATKVREAHERAKGGKGGGLAGKAGTTVALLMVGAWILDIATPSSGGGSSGGQRVLPGKG